MFYTYIKNLSDLNEVWIAYDLVNRAELKHHKVICASSKTFTHSSALDQLRPEDVQNSIKNEFHKLYPVALINPLIDTVNTGADKMSLICRRATFDSP